MVPTADTEIWLGNSKTQSQGMERQYQSPPLESGRDYTYTVKARWTRDGKAVEQTRDVTVRADQCHGGRCEQWSQIVLKMHRGAVRIAGAAAASSGRVARPPEV